MSKFKLAATAALLPLAALNCKYGGLLPDTGPALLLPLPASLMPQLTRRTHP